MFFFHIIKKFIYQHELLNPTLKQEESIRIILITCYGHITNSKQPSTLSFMKMMDQFSVFVRLIFLITVIKVNYSIQVIYPYGPTAGDAQLRVGYEVASAGIPLSVPVNFYNDTYDTIFVS